MQYFAHSLVLLLLQDMHLLDLGRSNRCYQLQLKFMEANEKFHVRMRHSRNDKAIT